MEDAHRRRDEEDGAGHHDKVGGCMLIALRYQAPAPLWYQPRQLLRPKVWTLY